MLEEKSPQEDILRESNHISWFPEVRGHLEPKYEMKYTDSMRKCGMTKKWSEHLKIWILSSN